MFALFRTGGKQYTVSEGDILRVENLEGEAGKVISVGEVLMVHDGSSHKVGSPTVKGATVEVEILAQDREKKILIFKKKRRHTYRRTKGHRQEVTVIKVKKIAA